MNAPAHKRRAGLEEVLNCNRSHATFMFLPSSETANRVRDAQRAIVRRILICLGLWFVPWISGVGCSLMEAELIHEVLEIVGRETSGEERNNLFWFFRGKTLFLNGSTYIPFAGTVLQAWEVYLVGQFALHCALAAESSLTVADLEKQWLKVEEHIFSGDRLVSSIEEHSGSPLPREVRKNLADAANCFGCAYRKSMSIPGMRWIQKTGTRGVRGALHFAIRQAASFGRRTVFADKVTNPIVSVATPQRNCSSSALD